MAGVAYAFPSDALTRICPKCHEDKPRDAYTEAVWNRTARGGYHCRDCNSKVQRDYKYKYLYGISTAEYEVLHVQQDGRCAFCGGLPTGNKRLAVDHDHETGRVRGLLCDKCNWAFGQLGDTASALLRAYEYMIKGVNSNG